MPTEPKSVFQAIKTGLLSDPRLSGLLAGRVRQGTYRDGEKRPGVYVAAASAEGQPTAVAVQAIGSNGREAKQLAGLCGAVLAGFSTTETEPAIVRCEQVDTGRRVGAAVYQAWRVVHAEDEPEPEEVPEVEEEKPPEEEEPEDEGE